VVTYRTSSADVAQIFQFLRISWFRVLVISRKRANWATRPIEISQRNKTSVWHCFDMFSNFYFWLLTKKRSARLCWRPTPVSVLTPPDPPPPPRHRFLQVGKNGRSESRSLTFFTFSIFLTLTPPSPARRRSSSQRPLAAPLSIKRACFLLRYSEPNFRLWGLFLLHFGDGKACWVSFVTYWEI